MKRLSIYILTGLLTCFTACSGFLDTTPYDALSPSTTWKTEDDAQKFVTGCYNNWLSGETLLYWDCASDFGYNNFPWEGWRPLGDGSLTASSPGAEFYDFANIQRCNIFMDNIENVAFTDESTKKDLIAQVRAMRAYDYFVMNFWYGGVPIVKYFTNAEEAQVPRDSEEAVKEYVYDEIDAAINDIADSPSARGRVAKGAALAIKMRSALYWNDLQRAKDAAQAIIDLEQYDLDSDYANLFTLAGQGSSEIILAVQYIPVTRGLGTIGQMYNNADGGWSSITPTQNLVDTYEMKDGLTIEESSDYDPAHPFKDRDPRMAMTVLFPGQDFEGGIFNTLDQLLPDGSKNSNYPLVADNASKTALTWAKYLVPMSQYGDIWDTGACPIVFRYAEVLLTFAEATNELTGPSTDVYDALDEIRTRAGMPAVERTKYNTKEKLRELIRRERGVELAGEGLRRADIVRWTDDSGLMLAETLLNGPLYRVVGTVDYDESDLYTRATIDVNADAQSRLIETRIFKSHNRYLPIPQSSIDKNPKLEQNTGY